jgi:transposase
VASTGVSSPVAVLKLLSRRRQPKSAPANVKDLPGARPPAFDAEEYKNRNVVERSFSLTKQWRALATRYDKLAITYRAAVVLHACIRWIKLLGDTP